jgi:hypothetical protein
MRIGLLGVGILGVLGNAGMVTAPRLGPRPAPKLAPPAAPAQVTDLSAFALSDTSVVLTWTEVRSSTTAIPRYVVRFDAASAYTWTSAVDIVIGGCGAPIVGASAAGGRPHACVLTGLVAHRAYRFQMVAYTGLLNSTAVFGPLSNLADATTAERIGPLLVWRPPVNPGDSMFVQSVSTSYYPRLPNLPLKGWVWAGSYSITGFGTNDSVAARGYLLVTKP